MRDPIVCGLALAPVALDAMITLLGKTELAGLCCDRFGTVNSENAVIGRKGSYAKGIARRQEILDRAIEVFAKRGAEGASLRRIAQAIGVSHGTLLHYFDSREQMLIAVYEHAESKWQINAQSDPSASAVDLMAEAAIRNAGVPGMVELYSMLVAASLEADNRVGKEFFTDRFEVVRAELVERLERGQVAGHVRVDVDLRDIATLIAAASDGLQIQWLLKPSIDLERVLRTFAVLLAP
ncbi:TetR/AcrR family transcriptional regulator [bacterium RCC_150]